MIFKLPPEQTDAVAEFVNHQVEIWICNIADFCLGIVNHNHYANFLAISSSKISRTVRGMMIRCSSRKKRSISRRASVL